MRHVVNEGLNENLRGLILKNLDLTHEVTRVSFFQNRLDGFFRDSCNRRGLIFAFTACQKEGPMEKAGKKADKTIEKAEKKVEGAADAVKKKTE
jgi:hypothetical protein